MLSKEKTKTTFLRLAGVSLGVLLVALGGTYRPGLSPSAPPTALAMAASPPSDGACQVLLDASEKIFTVPNHVYHVHTDVDGKTRSTEYIYVGGFGYSPVKGKWYRTPANSADMKSMAELAMKDNKNMSCHVVRVESVNGEIATVYSIHSETERGLHDGLVWISKSKGLLLREEIDTQTPGQSGKRHASVRLDYNNVQAPKGWVDIGSQ